MTLSIAITGKSGSGKTTLTKALLSAIKKQYPGKSILLVDNDLSTELGIAFDLEVTDTIYGIRIGKHEYKTGIPSQMSKQEYIDWALQDILVEVDENTDLITSWLVASKDCRCPITQQINDALARLFKNYDIIIFDCEYDLKYLHQLVDFPIDVTLIIANTTRESLAVSSRIRLVSQKYAVPGQLGVIFNRVGQEGIPQDISAALMEHDIDILGCLPYDENLKDNSMLKDSPLLNEAFGELLFRLNLPLQ